MTSSSACLAARPRRWSIAGPGCGRSRRQCPPSMSRARLRPRHFGFRRRHPPPARQKRPCLAPAASSAARASRMRWAAARSPVGFSTQCDVNLVDGATGVANRAFYDRRRNAAHDRASTPAERCLVDSILKPLALSCTRQCAVLQAALSSALWRPAGPRGRDGLATDRHQHRAADPSDRRGNRVLLLGRRRI